MKISKKLRNCYICCLPARVQAEIKREVVEEVTKALKDAGIDKINKAEMKELTAEAMASRVADVESLIEIEYF